MNIAITQTDPALEAIAEVNRLDAESCQVSMRLADIVDDIRWSTGSLRPFGLIDWRGHCIGRQEVERLRDQLLSEPDADPEKIEAEYLDAKARERAEEIAAREWDEAHGLTDMRRQEEALLSDYRKAFERLTRTVPTTPAGAIALLGFLKKNLTDEMFDEQHYKMLDNLEAAISRWRLAL
ncbi:hypothetical protein [Methylocystis echinoides]|uniref:hypothetical protein n=1 Tax=Methylocystis echinoides TaxID=29468 RepID=UPI0034121B08